MAIKIEPKIFRPVSLPPLFAGAPQGPAIASLTVFMFLFMAAAAFDYSPMPFLLLAGIVHFSLIWYGTRDPHLTNLIATSFKSSRKYRGLAKRKVKELAP